MRHSRLISIFCVGCVVALSMLGALAEAAPDTPPPAPQVSHTPQHRTLDISASIAELGGFQPGTVVLNVGDTLTLRFKSADAAHTIAFGPGLDVAPVEIDPEHSGEITLHFDSPNTYTFYCTRWCSANHWRMRGQIIVNGADGQPAAARRDPVVDYLIREGVDIDAAHNMDTHDDMPGMEAVIAPLSVSPLYGAMQARSLTIPPLLLNADWRKSHTPADAIALLQNANKNVSRFVLLNTIASLWTSSAADFEQARTLYNTNCASCHGTAGGGDGFAAGLATTKPRSFADVSHMLTMRSDVLYAKLRRGGMGTGMPNFGTLFTEKESWALVEYIWHLTFNALP